MHRTILVLVCGLLTLFSPAADPAQAPALFETDFRGVAYGRTPDGWRDLIGRRPSRNWAVDGNALLRPMLKNYTGLLVYDGILATAKPARSLTDGIVSAAFQKTEDERVSFGLVARVQDRDNHYLARFRGDSLLELLKVHRGKSQVLASLVTSRRYRDGERWRLTLSLRGDLLTAQLDDAQGRETARVHAQDGDWRRGAAGLCCTDFAAAASFQLAAPEPFDVVRSPAQIAKLNARRSVDVPDYPVVRPHWKTHELDTPYTQLADEYDIVVAGAGTGGFAAAVQAARLGCRVLLLEETDWIGGQMCAAAVASMDEDGGWGKYPVRERGIYREFHESMLAYYYTLGKDPFVAYFSTPQAEGGYEPKAARAVLYGFIAEARARVVDGKTPRLDLSLRSRVTSVRKRDDTVTGVTMAADTAGGPQRKEIACKVLIDATEYGDVIPLTGAPYRVGNVTSDKLDPQALVQDHTWTAVIREYPAGIPAHLQIKEAPPNYEEYARRRFKNYQLHGLHLWGAAGKGIKGPRTWRVYFAWRGMADADSPLIGDASGLRHTQCGLNGGNDYPVTVATIEDLEQRRRDERFGIERTFGTLYYFQHALGLNWSLAEDEGYDTPYSRKKMQELGLRPDLVALAVHLPQQPYVREARRIVGVRTLLADDLTRYEHAKLFPTAVAMGDYFMDLDHGKTAHAIEPDLDSGEPPRGGGPFQVPFEVFLPEKLEGFLPAEKNLSQSRLANGATRLQPITMLTGQAVGVIAALAVKQSVPPRQLDIRQVQSTLLDSGSTLVQRWYADVPWGTPIWKATQLLTLYQVQDRPGPLDKDNDAPLGGKSRWGVDEPLTRADFQAALARLAELSGKRGGSLTIPLDNGLSVERLQAALAEVQPEWVDLVRPGDAADPARLTAGEFAVVAARVLLHRPTK